MKNCRCLIFALSILFFNCSIRPEQVHTTDLKKTSVQRELLKEYFFCVCITEGFNNKQVAAQDISQAIYFDIMRYRPDAFQEVNDYAKRFVETIEPSPIEDLGNKKAIILNCIEKYKSKEVDKFIKSMDKYLVK